MPHNGHSRGRGREGRRPQIDLNELVRPNVGGIVAGLAFVVVVLLLVTLGLARRVRRLGRRIEGITRGEQGRSLEAILDAHLDKVYSVAREVDELTARAAILEANSGRAFQRIGLVRFNPFEDTGGNQSFAVALIDARGDGFVLSSLHARTGTRVYAKALKAGKADAALSSEEAEALRQAFASPIDTRTGRPAEGRGASAGAASVGTADQARPAS